MNNYRSKILLKWFWCIKKKKKKKKKKKIRPIYYSSFFHVESERKNVSKNSVKGNTITNIELNWNNLTATNKSIKKLG